MTDSAPWRDRPNRLPWPPMLLLGSGVAAYLLGRIAPLPGLPPTLALAGWAIIAIAIALDIAAMSVMWRARANILPNRAATALVTRFPFSRSRNPIYLANALLLVGAALAFANPWFLLAAVIASLAMQRLAIIREEAHLAAKFGAAWLAFAARTPRWFGPF